jgi:hypothetical protein
MTKYKCGHAMHQVLMNDCLMSIATYVSWAYGVGVFGDKSKCLTCYLEDCRLQFERLKKSGLAKKLREM